tara:strand:+ start:133 stop:336 length:204 start_codon:yes stop_codon:yes gene_type:complete
VEFAFTTITLYFYILEIERIPGRLLLGGEDKGVLEEIGEGRGERETFLSGRNRRRSSLRSVIEMAIK